MFKKDSMAHLERNRLVRGKKVVGVFRWSVFEEIERSSNELPVKVFEVGQKVWWVFRKGIYWEDEALTAEEVKLIILAYEEKRKQKIYQTLNSVETVNVSSIYSRERIPRHVQREVWQRDAGKCVRCGSQEKLELDHIIPVSRGGSNTANNVQLLCKGCNREKSNKIG